MNKQIYTDAFVDRFTEDEESLTKAQFWKKYGFFTATVLRNNNRSIPTNPSKSRPAEIPISWPAAEDYMERQRVLTATG